MSCTLINIEDLAALAGDELAEPQVADVREHLAACAECAELYDALQRVDGALTQLPRQRPRAKALLTTRKALADVARAPSGDDVMTLEDVAKALRLAPDELTQIVDELPAFELGGQVRVRRAKLAAWIEEREAMYRRRVSAAWSFVPEHKKGVA